MVQDTGSFGDSEGYSFLNSLPSASRESLDSHHKFYKKPDATNLLIEAKAMKDKMTGRKFTEWVKGKEKKYDNEIKEERLCLKWEEDFQQLKKKQDQEKKDAAHEKRIGSIIEFCAVLDYFSNI